METRMNDAIAMPTKNDSPVAFAAILFFITAALWAYLAASVLPVIQSNLPVLPAPMAFVSAAALPLVVLALIATGACALNRRAASRIRVLVEKHARPAAMALLSGSVVAVYLALMSTALSSGGESWASSAGFWGFALLGAMMTALPVLAPEIERAKRTPRGRAVLHIIGAALPTLTFAAIVAVIII